MTIDKPSPLVPKLRFPEFRDTPAWSESSLESACDILNNLRIPITTKDRKAGPYPYYGASGIVDYIDNFIFDEQLVLVGEDGAKWGAFEQTAFIADGKYWVNNHAHVLRSIGLIDSLLEAYLVRSDLGPYVTGAAPPKLTLGKLKTISIPIPLSGAEQKKIADCLSSLDDLIAAEDQKLQTLRQHKQGLMEQLFPRPGETVPRLRFPEFRDGPEWGYAPLGTLLIRAPDYGVNAAAVPFSNTLPTYIRITDINSDGQFVPCPRVSVDVDADQDRYLEDGDIVLARTGASVGKSYRYREEDGRLLYAGFLIRVRPDPQQLLSQFLAVYLCTWTYWDWVRLTSTRSGQPGINGAEYASMPLPLPPDGRELTEQQKIADCLSSLDDQISGTGRKVEALQMHKQGLMQQLFPSLEMK